MIDNKYTPLLNSLSELTRSVDNFILYPASPQTAPLAMQATSLAFYELLRIYTPQKEIYGNAAERFLTETSKFQNQIKALCFVEERNEPIRAIQKNQGAYEEKIEVRKDIVTKMQEGAHPDELRDILRSVVPEQI